MNEWAAGLLRAGFFTGCARYDDHAPGDDQRRIVVRAKVSTPDSLEIPFILDTGAIWNVISADTLEEMDARYEVLEQEKSLLIRGYPYEGRLIRTPVILVSQWGEDLTVDGIFLAIDERYVPARRLPYFLGYGGCLEWTRFALDPVTNLFCFGAAG